MHPIHREYVIDLAQPSKHTFEYFFALLDKLPNDTQQRIIGNNIFLSVIDFDDFRANPQGQLRRELEPLLVRGMVSDFLGNLFFGSNQNNKARWLENSEATYRAANSELQEGTGDAEMLERIKAFSDDKIDRINPEIAQTRNDYELFCENVVRHMLPGV